MSKVIEDIRDEIGDDSHDALSAQTNIIIEKTDFGWVLPTKEDDEEDTEMTVGINGETYGKITNRNNQRNKNGNDKNITHGEMKDGNDDEDDEDDERKM